MKIIKRGVLFLLLFVGFGFLFLQSNEVKPKVIFPDEMKWIESSDPNYKISTSLLSGDPKLEGLYATQVKINQGTKLFPHTHPDSRMVVVLSGKFLYAYGNKFDESKMKEMTPGTFFTEPANQPHFAWTKNSDVLLQVTGYGPSGTNYLNQK
ncbi:MAG: cupin domain-containing protein [Bacteroidota bacterium]